MGGKQLLNLSETKFELDVPNKMDILEKYNETTAL